MTRDIKHYVTLNFIKKTLGLATAILLVSKVASAQFTLQNMQKIQFERNNTNDKLSDLHSGDFNKDGFMDVVADGGLFINQSGFIENTSKPVFFINDGNGKLVPTPTTFTHPNTSSMIAAFADYNMDGYLDMLVYDFWANGMRLYNGGAELIFTLAQTLPTGTHGAKGIFEDFDKDGDLDIINVSSGSAALVQLHIFENQNGNFVKTSYTETSKNYAPFLWAKDMNRDGRMDVVYFIVGLDGDLSRVKVWLQNTDKTFTLQPEEAPHEKMKVNNNGRTTYAWSDLNGDGYDDLMFLDDLSLLMQDANNYKKVLAQGAYSNAASPFIGGRHDISGSIGMPFFGKMYQSLISGDVDNDGTDDLITHNPMDENESINYITVITDPFNKNSNFMLQNINLGAAEIKTLGKGLLLANIDNQSDLELISLGEDDTLRVFGATSGPITTSTKDILAGKNTFVIYPNPVNNTLNIQSDFIKENDIVAFKIYSIDGRLLATKPAKEYKEGISVSALSSGSYLLSVEMKNGNSYGKLFNKQ